MSVHLAHIKSYRPRQSAPASDFHKLEGLILGKTLPTPALEESETVPPRIGIYQVADVVGHRRRQGRHSPHSHIYCLLLKGFHEKELTSNTELTRSHNVKNLSQHTPLNINLIQSRLLLAISGSILLRKTAIPPGSDTAPEDGSPLESEPAIRKRPCNTRKHPASKDGNPPGSDAAPKDGNPPGSYAAREDGNPLGSDAASEDGNPLGSNAAPEDGSPLESEPAIRKRKPRSGSNKEKNNLKKRK